MADITLTLVPWGPDTIVGAYPRRSEQHLDDMPPTMVAPEETGVVAADASLTFTALPQGEYWACAPLGDSWQYIAFSAEDAPADMLALEEALAELAVNVKSAPYFAKGDGVTDDTAAVQGAITTAGILGAEVFFPAGRYYFTGSATQHLLVGSNTTLRGVRGASILDFSGRDTYTDGTDDALILAAGSLAASPTALTRDARKPPAIPVGLASVIRTGTVAEATTLTPHNLGAGDAVFIRGGGSGASVGQDPFYTETYNGVAADPVVVTAVADATHFSYAVITENPGVSGVAATDVLTFAKPNKAANHGYLDGDAIVFSQLTGGAGLSTGVTYYVRDKTTTTFKLAATPGGPAIDFSTDITAGSIQTDAAMAFPSTSHVSPFGKIALVGDTSGFTYDDMVLLSSNAVRTDAGAEVIRRGEVNFVERVVSPTMLLLQKQAQDDYLVSDGAALQKINPVSNVHVRDLEMVGKGTNFSLTGGGDKGIRFHYAHNCTVEQCVLRNLDLVTMEFRSSAVCAFKDNELFFDQRNVSGRVSGHAYVQYGCSYSNGTEHLNVSGNTFHGARHGVVQASGSSWPGIARGIIITENHFFGGWLGQISTHQGFEAGTIANNRFVGCQCAINIRYAERTLIDNNEIYGGEFGILISKHWDGVEITNNVIQRCWTAISTSSQISAADAVGNLRIQCNRIRDCETPIDIRPTLTGTVSNGMQINSNRIRGANGAAITVQVGSSTSTTDGFSGSISDNVIDDVCRVGSAANAILATNPRGVVFSSNRIESANMARGILVNGSGAQNCTDRGNVVLGASTAKVSFSTGNGHSSDTIAKQILALVNGALTPVSVSTINYLQTDSEPGKAATGVAAGDVITVPGHGWVANKPLIFTALTGGTGLTTNTQYYARDVTTDTFRLATTQGGAAIDFTTDITAATIAANGVDMIVPTGLPDGALVFLRSGSSGRRLLIRDAGATGGAGNIQTAGGTAVTLDSTRDKWMGLWDQASNEFDGFPLADV